MKILAVAPYVPFAGILHAGGAYLLHHLHELHRLGNDVSLIVPGTPTQLDATARAPDWLRVVPGPSVLARRGPVRRVRDAAYRRVMNSPPAPAAESLRSVLGAGLVRLAGDADVVELHWPEYARFATVLRRAGVRTAICVVEHDVDLESARRRLADHATGYRRWLGLLGAPLARWLERRGLMDADLIAIFKAADEELIRRAGVPTPVHVIDPWLDQPSVQPVDRHPLTVLFTGALWRRENEDGLIWLLREVWPHVAAAVPAAVLQLVGAGPTDRLADLAAVTSGVDLVGQVPDFDPYYLGASVFVAPLFAPGGLKFKVPQAMLYELPVLATTIAAAGVLDAAPADAFWTVSDDPGEWRLGLVRALRDPGAAARVGRIGAQWSRSRYCFTESISRLNETYGRLT